jgi:autotransporter-associated beta strand protein
VDGAGTVILSGFNNTYSGGTLINNGTLQFGDEFGLGILPPAGNIPNNGTLATTLFGTLANNISGTGGVTILSNASVTLSGANTYSGPTRVVGYPASLTADAANYAAGSVLVLGNTNGGPEIGLASFNSGNPVLGGLIAGGNSASPGNAINLLGSGQTLTVNGNMIVGNVGPIGASIYLPVTGSGASMAVVTNGGTIQIGLGAAGSGVNPDNVFVDLSLLDSFTADLGASGVINLGTLDGNPGPAAGATVVNWFKLASASNHITAGSLNVGAGGRQLVPELFLGAGTYVLNVGSLICGSGGRDGSYVHFEGASGGLQLRGSDGVSAAIFAVGNNPATGTGASITNTVDFTGHPVDLLVSTLTIGNYNNAGVYQNTVSLDQGILNAQSTSLSLIRNNNGNAAVSGSTLNIGGGTSSLGPVSLTASAAYGTLNVSGGANVTVQNITSPGAGAATLDVNGSTLNIDIQGFGNPASAPVQVDTFNASGSVTLNVNGTGWTVGTFALIDYSGAIGGIGFAALNLVGLPPGVTATLVDNVANSSVDLNVTAAPPAINPNPGTILSSVTGATLSLWWPTNAGWELYTNSVEVTSSGDWHLYPGSAGVTNVNITIDPAEDQVYFRLQLP